MPRTSHTAPLGRWSNLLYWGVLITVLWAPLPFGSIEPWAVGLLKLVAIALVAAWVAGSAIHGTVAFNRSPLQLLLVGGVTVAAFQTIALSGGSPASVDVFSTQQTAATLACLTALFSVSLVAIDSRERLEVAATALFWLGFALSVFAILQSLSGTTRLYWFRETNGQLLFGPFPNKNHFAGLMEIVLPLGLGLLSTGAIARARRPLYVFGGLVIAVAVVLSRSRGGLLSLIAECLFLGVVVVLVAPDGPSRVRRIALVTTGAAVLAAAVTVGVVWVGADAVVASISDIQDATTDDSAISRVVIWRDTLSLVRDHPLLGTGLGAYGVAFAKYTQSTGTAAVLYAHNDYLQVLADTGATGAVLAILFIAGLASYALKGVRARDPVLKGIVLGGSAGCFGILVHSWVDFNLQIPSNALAFLFAVGMVVRASQLATNGAQLERRTMS